MRSVCGRLVVGAGLAALVACSSSSSPSPASVDAGGSDASVADAAALDATVTEGFTVSAATPAGINGTFALTGADQNLAGDQAQILFADASKTRMLEVNFAKATGSLTSVIWSDPAITSPGGSIECTVSATEDPCNVAAVRLDVAARTVKFLALDLYASTGMRFVKNGKGDGALHW